jgi:hypothetical protein
MRKSHPKRFYFIRRIQVAIGMNGRLIYEYANVAAIDEIN